MFHHNICKFCNEFENKSQISGCLRFVLNFNSNFRIRIPSQSEVRSEHSQEDVPFKNHSSTIGSA